MLLPSILGIALAALGADTQPRVLPSPAGEPWVTVAIRGVERGTEYTPAAPPTGRPAGAPQSVRASSRCGASMRVLLLDDVDLHATPRLAWQWRIDRGLDSGAEQTAGGDDFAARVSVAFRLDRQRAGVLTRTWHRLSELLYGDELPATALTYVWTRQVEAGERWPNPYTESSRMIAQARGNPDGWRREVVDVLADYRREFGIDPPPVRGVGLMTDADNGCQNAEARYADFEFLPPA